METPGLIALHLRIDTAMKNIMKNGKLDKHEIPILVLMIADFVLTPSSAPKSAKFSSVAIMEKMDQMYDYIMNHYNLYPTDEGDKAVYKEVFDASVRLTLLEPNLKKACNSCLF